MKEILRTEDRSFTLYNREIDETYHSIHGAKQESELIFIEYGLRSVDKNPVYVFEVGFGSGLNAFLSALESEKRSRMVYYTSIEYYPLSSEEASLYARQSSHDEHELSLFSRIIDSPWDGSNYEKISETFYLKKLTLDFTEITNYRNVFLNPADIIFFDAFSPEKNPNMWTQELFDFLFFNASSNSVLTTYCAKGVVRRTLSKSGFIVERLPGPIGKREVLRARKII